MADTKRSISEADAETLREFWKGESWGRFTCVDVIEGAARRWFRNVHVIFQDEDAPGLWMYTWGRGLTECQDDEEIFEPTVILVEPFEVITVDYRPVQD